MENFIFCAEYYPGLGRREVDSLETVEHPFKATLKAQLLLYAYIMKKIQKSSRKEQKMYLKFPGSRTPRKESVKSMWWYANIRKNLKRYVYTKQTFNMRAISEKYG